MKAKFSHVKTVLFNILCLLMFSANAQIINMHENTLMTFAFNAKPMFGFVAGIGYKQPISKRVMISSGLDYWSSHERGIDFICIPEPFELNECPRNVKIQTRAIEVPINFEVNVNDVDAKWKLFFV